MEIFELGKNQYTGPDYEMAKIEALKLWLGGASYVSIGEIQGVADTTAKGRVEAALDDMRPHADYAAYQARQMAEMEQVRQRLMRLVLSGEDVIDAARELRGLWEQERRVLGKHESEETPIDKELRRLAKLSDEQLVIEAFGRPTNELVSGELGSGQSLEGSDSFVGAKPDS